MTDDESVGLAAVGSSKSIGTLGRTGTRFTNSIVTTPLCCPSRAAFLTGQYGHNNGVVRNDPGYPRLAAPANVLPAWLVRAGYRTAFVGKFMNGYSRTARADSLRPAPGWEEWVVMRRPFSYFGYTLNEDGTVATYGQDRTDYLTRVLTQHALASIQRLDDDRRPLFLWLAHWAPHNERAAMTAGSCNGSPIPSDRQPADVPHSRLPGPADLESHVADKPRQIRLRPRLDEKALEELRTRYRCGVGALRSVDRGLGRILRKLRKLGELRNTVVVFTSDNGILFGQHRIAGGKSLPYEEAIRVPLVVDLPTAYGDQVATVDAPVANIDLAPSFLDLAGARPCVSRRRCRRLDGRSLLPLIMGDAAPVSESRPLLVESGKGKPCPFAAVRHREQIFVRYRRKKLPVCRDLELEMYDLRNDPDESANVLGAADAAHRELSGRASEMSALLDRLMECGGVDPRRHRCP